MPQATKKYRIETDKGSFEVEVEEPSAPINPSAKGGDTINGQDPNDPSFFTKIAQNPMLEGAAEPRDMGDFLSLLIPSGIGEAVGFGRDMGRIAKQAASESPTWKGIPGQILRNIRERPKSLQDFQTRGFNDLPLAEQMDHLPSAPVKGRPTPILKMGGGPPTISGDINDLPLARQMDMLPETGGTGSVRGGGLPIAEQQRFNDLPLHRQQVILDSTTPAREAPITTRGGGNPPMRPPTLMENHEGMFGPAEHSDDFPSSPPSSLEDTMMGMMDESPVSTADELRAAPEESVVNYTDKTPEPEIEDVIGHDPSESSIMDAVESQGMPLGKPRVKEWKAGQGPSDELIGQLRDAEGSKSAAHRLAIPQKEVTSRAPRMSPRDLPPDVKTRIATALEGMSPEEKLTYLASAPNGLTEAFIKSQMGQ